jgi:hypothetical protein
MVRWQNPKSETRNSKYKEEMFEMPYLLFSYFK